MLLIKHLFKYGFVVGLLLLLQFLNGSGTAFKKRGGEKKVFQLAAQTIQPWKNYWVILGLGWGEMIQWQ